MITKVTRRYILDPLLIMFVSDVYLQVDDSSCLDLKVELKIVCLSHFKDIIRFYIES